ncbi:MAG: hypothetical protein HYU41_02980 [Candidatus Rokubacteria bacterium]|nr:hypothetical protein [Candidatus Rokubacteria bacterium]
MRDTIVGGFLAVFLIVMIGEYVAFRRGLEALAELRVAGAALTLYFLESVLVLVLLIALISFIASGLWIFYRARDTGFLRATPLPLWSLFALRSSETVMVTSWALAIVGIPAVLALGLTYRAPIAFYAGAAVVLALFALFAAGLATLVTTLAAAALVRVPTRFAVGSTVAVLVLVFAIVVGKNVVPSVGDFHTIFEPEMLNGKPASIKFIERKFTWWPSHPFAASLYTSATGGAAGSSATRAGLWLLPLVSIVLAATLGRRLYARTLPVVMEAFTVLRSGDPARVAARPFPRRLRGPVGALIERDLLTLVRNPHELSRMAFIAFLLALYTSFVFIAPLREAGDRPHALARLMIFNVTAAGYFLTAFGLRFVFPSVSLEGRVAWIFFSSPLRVRRFVLAKLALAATLLTVAVVPIAMAGTLRLVRDVTLAVEIGGLLVLLSATTATLLLAFGTAWPDFRERDAEVLGTSGAGLASTVACLVYVAVIGWIAWGTVLARTSGGNEVPWLGAGVAVSAVLVAGALALIERGIRSLEAR